LSAACIVCACAVQPTGNDGALVVLLPRDVQEIDPRFSGDAYGLKLSRLLFASLVTIDSQSLQVVPDLAESVVIESPTRYRIRLRAGLRFSDGSALDADDVVATFASIVDPKLKTRYAETYARIERVEVIDAHDLVFHLRGPHATFLTDLEIPIMRAEDRSRQVGRLGGPPPVGAGPYTMTSRRPGHIELQANPFWHRGRARHARVRMLVVRDDNTRALRLLAGAGDLAQNAIPALLLPLFEHDSRFAVQSAPGVGTTYIGLNLDAPALHDVRVRRAIAYALDRRALIRAKLGGYARLASSWIVPGHWAHTEAIARYGYDVARAKALLRDAGLTAVDDRPALTLSLRCGNDRFRQSIARAIAAMLAEVGIAVEIRSTEIATLIADLGAGRFEMTMLEVPEVVEPHVLSWFFGSDHVPGEGHEGANRWRMRSAALDAALERGRANTDLGVRFDAYREAQRILADELPVIPLWHEDVVSVKSRRARAIVVPRLGRFDVLAL